MAQNCSQGDSLCNFRNKLQSTDCTLGESGTTWQQNQNGVFIVVVLILWKPFKSAWYFPPQNQKFSEVDEIRNEEKKRKES